jgi:hypothetical protein
VASLQLGRDLAKRLMDVLGIADPVTRIVIVADVKDIARVYVQRPLTADPADVAAAVAGVEPQEVASVEVSPDGFVSVKE